MKNLYYSRLLYRYFSPPDLWKNKTLLNENTAYTGDSFTPELSADSAYHDMFLVRSLTADEK